jgi:1-hydroxycarotenoid 3,4-desaturase
MPRTDVVVVGAGVGGLTAALRLAHSGLRVQVVERTCEVGGKMHVVRVGEREIDAGPTVLTMRGIFDRLLGEVGERLDDELALRPLELLARHAWDDGARLDLFADPARTLAAVRDFAGPHAADELRRFRTRIAELHARIEPVFLDAPDVSIGALLRAPWGGLAGMVRADWHRTLWGALGRDFADPRLRQLFARYATYVGSSPFAAPATLALIAHVEMEGVWTVDGGMIELSRMLARLARDRGAEIRLGIGVKRLCIERGRVTGAVLDDDELVEARAVVVNADPRALSTGLFGEPAIAAASRAHRAPRSLSAITWAMLARPRGFPLARHNVFFSTDYRAEFDALARGELPVDPTVYVHAQDRDHADASDLSLAAGERLLCLVNAPAVGDREGDLEIESCRATMMRRLARCGLSPRPLAEQATTPRDFSARFPATGGALYGSATHGPFAPFSRPPIRTPIEGLVLAGGGTHPGAGVPMVAKSGLFAARSVLSALASTSGSHPVATPGGTSMPLRTKAITRSP